MGISLREQSDARLVSLFRSVRQQHLAWGFRLIYTYLRAQGHCFCKHRGHQLYKKAGLSLYRTPKKKRLQRIFEPLEAPQRIDQGWAMDFMSEVVIGKNQQTVRLINIMDEYSRKDLWIEAHHSCRSEKLIGILEKILAFRSAPAYIRCDNGPEFISVKLAQWAKDVRFTIWGYWKRYFY